jgi:3alpha(or 20beta)-hydroxysteroid dehydrogenase/cyclopentanol dehydrogenase
MCRLDNRVAIVTGAGRIGNIGQAVCEAFLAEGAAGVVATDLRGEEAAALTERLGGDRFLFLTHDVADEAGWRRVLAATVERFGGLDILVNNAGISVRANSAELGLEEFRKVMDVNLYGCFLGTKVCAPAIAERANRHPGGGAIINVSSMSAYMPSATSFAYHCSKSAVRMLTMCTSKELGPQGIRVNSIHPGPITTPMLREAFHGYARAGLYPSAAEAEAGIAAQTSLGRLCAPEDMAATFVYLASDDARYVTGAAMQHDGGVGSVF